MVKIEKTLFNRTADVYISYSTQDKYVADATCATLEQNDIRCWIAPRDVPNGVNRDEWTNHAIAQSKVFVLIFSSDSDQSSLVLKEVETAVNMGLTIIPFRIEDVEPSESMEYFISATHWLDAVTPPLETHLQKLTQTIDSIMRTNQEYTLKQNMERSSNSEWDLIDFFNKKDKNRVINRIVAIFTSFIFLYISISCLDGYGISFTIFSYIYMTIFVLSSILLVLGIFLIQLDRSSPNVSLKKWSPLLVLSLIFILSTLTFINIGNNIEYNKNGIAFTAPEFWTSEKGNINQTPEGADSLAEFNYQYNSNDPYNIKGQVCVSTSFFIIKFNDSASLSPEAFFHESFKEFPSYTLISERNFTLNGITAYENIHKINETDPNYTSVNHAVLLEKNGSMYIIHFSTREENYENTKTMINEFLSSFQIT
ncbi:MAG: toll/interleukin-1 receptor domain-containing protein [Methanobacterium sp.]|uniref:toll/interleukin-1 receptor domain-containing protein n=1 Tax=Methanobacterium sp. TaxID=2164 RepID=UPI003D64DCB6|nr:toll/interleukin-1 receptor domain-containing protein [Methanobacterium sp.]